MIQVSNAYKELVKSNIRPKCEPTIKVTGKDNNGNDIELIWGAKNIKDLKYKRSIDPVGRELPYMELTWTEIYTGKLNAESYPEKYNNVTKYMTVELSFVQDLGFYNTWKTLFDNENTWKELFAKRATWKQLKNKVSQETITMPKLFLSARPSISGQTITWVAKDLLSFANENQLMEFIGSETTNPIFLKNVISYFTLNLRGAFLNSSGLFKAYTDTVTELLKEESINEIVDKRIICDGNTNNIILNLSSIYNYYLDFKDNIFVMKKFNPSSVSYKFKNKVLYSHPKIENSTNISSYGFKYRVAEADQSKAYYKKPIWAKEYAGDFGSVFHMHYVLDDYGEAYISNENLENRLNGGDIKTADLVGQTTDPNQEIYVIPIKYNSYDDLINIDNIGETFFEDNPINPYSSEDAVSMARKDFLNNYFTNNSSVITFEGLPNLSIEPDDFTEVDTNLYQTNNEKITKKALVVYMELSYSGSLKQKIIAHEVNL